MRIIITMHKLYHIKKCMEELYDRYHDITRKYNRLNNTIIFVNGDVIKGYSADSRKDGARADVALGVDAEYITCRSEVVEPVWNIEKLYKYLDNAESTIEKYLQQLEKDIVNGTSNKTPIGMLGNVDL